MKKKVLFVATVDSHIRFFHIPYLKYFNEQGYEVHVATNGIEQFPYCDVKHRIPMAKTPFHLCNFKAYRALTKLIREENFEIIHCHMPVGGALTRLAARSKRKEGTKVIYTAHGFHFYSGAPLINWMIYYPVEKLLAHDTDCLITINEEDYKMAVSHHFKAGHIAYIRGVGVNLERFRSITASEKQRLRRQYGYQDKDIILTYVAELNKNKNQSLLINCLPVLKDKIPNLKVIFIGKDSYNGRYQKLSKTLQVETQVKFLGERKDIPQLLGISDLYIATSKREGLPLNIMEAMAMGLPICATANRGHNELVEDGVNGKIVMNQEELMAAILMMNQKNGSYSEFKEANMSKIKRFELGKVKQEMSKVYQQYMGD